MSADDLPQAEADALLDMPKVRTDTTVWDFPGPGEKLTIPLVSDDGREDFALDLEKSRIKVLKQKYQTRGRQISTLARLDFAGAPHQNPDGEEIEGTHLHVYKEGFGDKWAYPLDPDDFSDPEDMQQLWDDFMRYCNVTEPPDMRRGLIP